MLWERFGSISEFGIAFKFDTYIQISTGFNTILTCKLNVHEYFVTGTLISYKHEKVQLISIVTKCILLSSRQNDHWLYFNSREYCKF